MNKQRGSVTIMVIIVLVAMLFVVAAVIRSAETTTHLTSSAAYHHAAKTSADIGIYSAMQQIVDISDPETAITDVYYPLMQPVDAAGLPTTVDWDDVPSQTVDNFEIQYVIERLCNGTTPVVNLKQECIVASDEEGGSKKIGAPVYIETNKRYYRITVRVTVPKQTQVFVQSIIAK